MKCIRNNNTSKISRVSDAIAQQQVDAGKAKFVSKQAWKEEVRDCEGAA